MYELLATESAERELSKLQRKDKIRYEQVKKKVRQICENPYCGKPLRNIMKGKWRIHVGEHVLTYEIYENRKMVKLIDYAHHDDAYK